MRVKALTNIGTIHEPLPPLKEGEEADVSQSAGETLVGRGWAVDITPQPKIEAVPPAPSIQAVTDGTVEKATEDVKDYRAKNSRENKPSK